MVAVSHVLWTTGQVLDVAAICAAAHAAGAPLLLDGAQSAGAIAVDVAATGADFYAFSGQKWLLGPQGSGGLWVSPDWTDRAWTAQSELLEPAAGTRSATSPTTARPLRRRHDRHRHRGRHRRRHRVGRVAARRPRRLAARTARQRGRARERLRREPGVTWPSHGQRRAHR